MRPCFECQHRFPRTTHVYHSMPEDGGDLRRRWLLRSSRRPHLRRWAGGRRVAAWWRALWGGKVGRWAAWRGEAAGRWAGRRSIAAGRCARWCGETAAPASGEGVVALFHG